MVNWHHHKPKQSRSYATLGLEPLALLDGAVPHHLTKDIVSGGQSVIHVGFGKGRRYVIALQCDWEHEEPFIRHALMKLFIRRSIVPQ